RSALAPTAVGAAWPNPGPGLAPDPADSGAILIDGRGGNQQPALAVDPAATATRSAAAARARRFEGIGVTAAPGTPRAGRVPLNRGVSHGQAAQVVHSP